MHKKRFSNQSFALACALFLSAANSFAGLHAVLVNKKTNQAFLTEYRTGGLEIIKTYHSTLGKVVGDKLITDDKKTPEGIYFVTAKRTPPNLLKKFGAMAFPVDYPNVMDRMEKKTGFGIMLHSTDDPSRLKRDYDSDGCVVVDNHEIKEMDPYIRLGLTPMIVYEDMKKEYLTESYKPKVKQLFENWLAAWRGKDIDGYIKAYHEDFKNKGMGVSAYKSYKSSLNQKYERIEVKADNIHYFYHPKYDVVTFTQDYQSYNKAGKSLFRSAGTKYLYIKADASGNPGIIHEDFNHISE